MSKMRNYNCKDADMLLASKTIINNLFLNLAELSLLRSDWTVSYVDELDSRIDNAMDNYLGLDRKMELREATVIVTSIQASSLRDLAFMKAQIEVDFAKTAKMILKRLGYDKNYRGAYKGDQEALIKLLYRFKDGMNGQLKEDMVSRGMNAELIDRIISYTDQLRETNVSRETLNEVTKNVSAQAIEVLNEIYNDVIEVCKIASNFYQYDSLKKDQFTFSKVVKNLNVAKKIPNEANV